MGTEEHKDQVLISKYRQSGDQIWLARLFQKYEHLIYGICLKYSNDPDWSKDLKSQIYERLVIKIQDIDPVHFKNWLYSISKNLCLDEVRKKKNKVSALDKYRKFQIDTQEAVQFGFENRLIIEEEQKDIQLLMNAAIDSLNEKQKLCLKLFFLRRFSYAEIGQETGLEVKQIKSHLQNGKRKMKNYVYQHLYKNPV